ncbi:hypothetical protein, partial [Streptomyces turgidiscabies]|uniref:hypothetical protein n=1 Tax=Streptomyces turgidiscabies TaxID=85558 RepID=UPI0038F6C187
IRHCRLKMALHDAQTQLNLIVLADAEGLLVSISMSYQTQVLQLYKIQVGFKLLRAMSLVDNTVCLSCHSERIHMPI